MENIKQLLSSCDFAKFGTMTEDIYTLTDKRYSEPRLTIRKERPRVCVTADILPRIRLALDNPEYTVAADAFRTYINEEYDGVLGEPQKDFLNRKGFHNFYPRGLAIIEAKAMNYLLTGEEKYGYEAIYALFNFIDTMNIPYIASDGCREHGYAMFIAAEVYDWCYDLFTGEQRLALIAAVETRLCAGQVGDPSLTEIADYKLKMEIGFPPVRQSGINGHGAEAQLMRDYLAFAIAIYDENPSWWELCAGRLQDDYIPFRADYLKTGLYPQGTSNYMAHRFYADMYSAWLFTCATGTNPYTNIEEVITSVFAMELPDGNSIFACGDGPTVGNINRYRHVALISASVTRNPLHWACAKAAGAFTESQVGHTCITAASFLIFVSGGSPTVADRYEYLPVQLYNGYHLGMLTSRARWYDPSAPAMQMKIGVKSTFGHDHGDGGTFQIYYKAPLAHGAGLYDYSSHFQTHFYHSCTIAHNGLIFFDPTRSKPESDVLAEKWYSGSQRHRRAIGDWFTADQCITGEVTGVEYGYKDEAKKESAYAYLAGNIAAAYSGEVSYASRQMLNVYTDDTDFPMVFFVRDDFTVTSPEIEKKFLFHIVTPDAPVMTDNTVTVENGGGRLVLTSLTDDALLEGIGGKGHQHWIAGQECLSYSGRFDTHWGRVEISLPVGPLDGGFMHVLYVTDAGSDKKPPVPVRINGENVIGARFGSYAALFAADRDFRTESFSFSMEEAGCVYLCGISAGEWQISANGEPVTVCTATDEGRMIVWKCPAGTITVCKKH